MPNIIRLPTWFEWYQKILDGSKTVDIRRSYEDKEWALKRGKTWRIEEGDWIVFYAVVNPTVDEDRQLWQRSLLVLPLEHGVRVTKVWRMWEMPFWDTKVPYQVIQWEKEPHYENIFEIATDIDGCKECSRRKPNMGFSMMKIVKYHTSGHIKEKR